MLLEILGKVVRSLRFPISTVLRVVRYLRRELGDEVVEFGILE